MKRTLVVLGAVVGLFSFFGGVAQAETCPLDSNTAYAATESRAVYMVTDTCERKIFTNPAVYFSYFESWDDIHRVDETVVASVPLALDQMIPYGPLATFQNGSILKVPDDAKVYVLIQKELHWISTEEVYRAYGFTFDKVEIVTQELVDTFEFGVPFNDPERLPAFIAVQYAGDEAVYLVVPTIGGTNIKQHIVDEDVFRALDYRFDRVVEIPETFSMISGDDITNAEMVEEIILFTGKTQGDLPFFSGNDIARLYSVLDLPTPSTELLESVMSPSTGYTLEGTSMFVDEYFGISMANPLMWDVYVEDMADGTQGLDTEFTFSPPADAGCVKTATADAGESCDGFALALLSVYSTDKDLDIFAGSFSAGFESTLGEYGEFTNVSIDPSRFGGHETIVLTYSINMQGIERLVELNIMKIGHVGFVFMAVTDESVWETYAPSFDAMRSSFTHTALSSDARLDSLSSDAQVTESSLGSMSHLIDNTFHFSFDTKTPHAITALSLDTESAFAKAGLFSKSYVVNISDYTTSELSAAAFLIVGIEPTPRTYEEHVAYMPPGWVQSLSDLGVTDFQYLQYEEVGSKEEGEALSTHIVLEVYGDIEMHAMSVETVIDNTLYTVVLYASEEDLLAVYPLYEEIVSSFTFH